MSLFDSEEELRAWWHGECTACKRPRYEPQLYCNAPHLSTLCVLGMAENKKLKKVVESARNLRAWFAHAMSGDDLTRPVFVPPGNIESLDTALDDLDGVKPEDRLPIFELKPKPPAKSLEAQS